MILQIHLYQSQKKKMQIFNYFFASIKNKIILWLTLY